MKNSFYKELFGLAQDATDELDKFERGENNKAFDYIRRLGVACLEGDSIRQSMLDDFPLKEHSEVRKVVFSSVKLNTLSNSEKNVGIRSYITYLKLWANDLSLRTKRAGEPKVFYSWQATLAGSANRHLIRNSLVKGIEALNKELAVEDRNEATIDSDTANTPGSPDIIRIILSKIDAATIFVADVTLVNETQPNANVMFELGYAIKSLGESNIILLFNEHYGKPKDLPFDLGFKRAMLYRCDPEAEDKSAVKKELASRLKGAIEAILAESAE